jgi:ABC-2 type transport system ATP-binding protein
MTAISASALKKHFPPDIHAVDGIDLDIPPGQVFGFLGVNGSGKTTTVKMLTTLLRPTEGSAAVDGLDVIADAPKLRRRIGVALQEAALDDIQTGRELLTLQARLYRVPGARVAARVGELLEIVDLSDAADRPIKTYSGGMKRRLDLAAALVHSPKIIFLDEPTTGLDPISRDAIWRYITRINQEDGVTIFLTTQYLEEADRLAHVVAIMDRGRIIASGTPEQLKASVGADVITVRVAGDGTGEVGRAVTALKTLPGLQDVRDVDHQVVIYIRDGKSAVAPVVRALDDASITFEGVTLSRPTLDDVFLQATGHHLEAEAAGSAK